MNWVFICLGMACWLFSTKPLHKPLLNYKKLLIKPFGAYFSEVRIKMRSFSLKKCIRKCFLQEGNHFVLASIQIKKIPCYYLVMTLCHLSSYLGQPRPILCDRVNCLQPLSFNCLWIDLRFIHYIDVIMGLMASQITSLTIVYSRVYSGSDQRKHQSNASLAFVWGIHRSLVNSPHKRPVTRKMFPFDDVIISGNDHQPIATCWV